MTQKINLDVWEEHKKEMKEEKEKVQGQSKIQNSNTNSSGLWIRKVVDKVKISDLASEFGISKCPRCDYDLNFDNSRGWFCCEQKRWNGNCNFAGNIVDFMEFADR